MNLVYDDNVLVELESRIDNPEQYYVELSEDELAGDGTIGNDDRMYYDNKRLKEENTQLRSAKLMWKREYEYAEKKLHHWQYNLLNFMTQPGIIIVITSAICVILGFSMGVCIG